MEFINMGSFIRAREASRIAIDATHSDSPSDQTDLKAMATEILGWVKNDATPLVMTNQGMGNTNDGYFIASLNADEIELSETKSFQKISYRYQFNQTGIEMNGRPVDRSFVEPFLRKMGTIIHLVKDNKAKITTKRMSS